MFSIDFISIYYVGTSWLQNMIGSEKKFSNHLNSMLMSIYHPTDSKDPRIDLN